MENCKPLPYDKSLDNAVNLMQEGYLFIKNRVDRYSADLFETRLLLQNTICITGKDAVKLFYDPDLFHRHNAVQKRVQKTLFGLNGIQTLDGKSHLHRKSLFMSLTTLEIQKQIAQLAMEQLQSSGVKWEEAGKVVLFDEAESILCEIACHWADVPLKKSEARKRANDFSAMVDAFGAVGPRYWKGRKARIAAEKWIKEILSDVRTGRLESKEGSALHTVAFYDELNGSQLDIQIAAVELINILRPIVAIATYIIFAALALHEYPECQEKLRSGDDKYLEMFVQEVRRFYPLTPFIGARVRKNFIWNQYQFNQEMFVLLDVYGTNHDSRIWENPNNFQPERFQDYKFDLFDFIPQGGGDPAKGHRCPGEGVTTEVMKTFINFLVNKIDYEVPQQDLSYSLARIPTLPKSGLVMSNIRKKLLIK